MDLERSWELQGAEIGSRFHDLNGDRAIMQISNDI